MSTILTRALRGWSNLWGHPDMAGPTRIASDAEVVPVYDVGPAAHWTSRYADQGWGIAGNVAILTGGAELIQADIDIRSDVLAFGIPPDGLADTTVWVVDALLYATNGVTWDAATVSFRLAPTQSGGGPIALSVDRLLAAGAVIRTTGVPSSGTQAANAWTYKALPAAVRPGNTITTRVNVTAANAMDILKVNLLLWIGSDGSPPPGT